MRVTWSPLSIERITEIAKYISEEDRSAAVELVNHLFSRVEQLSNFPESGQAVPELNRTDIRQLVDGSYRIIYRVRADDISILTVRHYRQHLSKEDI